MNVFPLIFWSIQLLEIYILGRMNSKYVINFPIFFFAQTYHLKYSLSLKFFHVFLKNVEPFDILRLVIHYFILDASMLYLLTLIVLSIEILSRIQGCCRIVGNLPRDKKRAVKRSVWWTGTTEGGATTQHKTGCTGSGRGWGGRSLSINILGSSTLWEKLSKCHFVAPHTDEFFKDMIFF